MSSDLPPRRRGVLALIVAAAVAVLCAGAVTAGLVLSRSDSTTTRPHVSAEALLNALRSQQSHGYSGTLVAQLNLSLPVAVSESTGMPVLLMSGAHTLRYWYGGPERQRIALQRADSEADVFRIGSTVWQWDSATNVAVHSQLPGPAADRSAAPLLPAPITYAALTPQSLATRTAAISDATTDASVAAGPTVAGRATYRLTLRPKPQFETTTRTASVSIEIDTRTMVPLGVQVYARGVASASIDVAFSAISYAMPAAEYFQFTPPPSSKVRDGMSDTSGPSAPATASAPRAASSAPSGSTDLTAATSGWAGITSFGLPAGAKPADVITWPMLPVSGTWGQGYLMNTKLLCVLITADGQVLSGSVDPNALYAAAGG